MVGADAERKIKEKIVAFFVIRDELLYFVAHLLAVGQSSSLPLQPHLSLLIEETQNLYADLVLFIIEFIKWLGLALLSYLRSFFNRCCTFTSDGIEVGKDQSQCGPRTVSTTKTIS